MHLSQPPAYILFRPDRPNGLKLLGLPENVMPIQPFRTIRPFTIITDKTKIQVHRLQMPLLPCWAMTIAKCQGQNIKYSIADVDPPPTGSPLAINDTYVAFTRSSGRDNIRLLRRIHPRVSKLLRTHVNEYLRTEDVRLRRQATDTSTAFRHGKLWISHFSPSAYDAVHAYSIP